MKKDKHRYVAYCGIDCRGCYIRKSSIAELAEKLEKDIERSGLEQFAPALSAMVEEMRPLQNFGMFKNALAALKGYSCAKICKQGGGSTGCRIRLCCEEKKVFGCWECDTFESCSTLAWLRPINGEENLRNIRKLRAESHGL